MHFQQDNARWNKGKDISQQGIDQHFSVGSEQITLIDTLEVPVAVDNVAFIDTLEVPAMPEGIALIDTLYLPSVMENIALLDTLHLPVIAAATKERGQTGSQQAVARTANSAVIAGLGDLISAILRYAINVIMTNLVSQSIFGIYATVYTAVTVIGSIAVFGLDSVVVRFLPTYLVKKKHGLIGGLLRFVVLATLLSGLLAGILFYFSANVIAHVLYHQDGYALPLQEGTLLIPLFGLQLVLGNSLTALKALKWKVYADRLMQPGLCLILMLTFYSLGLRLEALILATLCSFLASVATEQVFLRKVSRPVTRRTRPQFEYQAWSRFALPIFLNSFIQNALSSTDMLFLAAFATTAQVGLYTAADRAALFVIMPYYSLNVIFPPIIAEYFARGEREQLVGLARTVTKWSFSLSWPVFLCFCVFHDAILGVFSREYIAGSAVLIMVSFGNIVDAGVGSVGQLLAMTGHARTYLVNTMVAITANIALAFWLVPRFNTLGAAIATTLAVAILNIASLIEVYCILKIFLFRWDIAKPILAGGVAALVGLFLVRVIPVGYGYSAIIGSLCLVSIFVVIYVLMLVVLRLSKEDRIVLDMLLAKFGKKKNT